MNPVWRIAWRNIFRHKGKTAVIGSILFLGAFILTLGSSIIAGLNRGLESNLVHCFTGDVVIISNQQKTDAVLASMSAQNIEPIPRYLALKPLLQKIPYIQAFLPIGVGYVVILNDTGQPVDQYILGVNFEAYRQFFPHTMTFPEGHYPAPNSKSLLLSHYFRQNIYDYTGDWLTPNPTLPPNQKTAKLKHDIVLMGLSAKNTTLDIRLPVTGIFAFPALNTLLGLYSIVDIDSFRECLGYFTTQDQHPTLTTEQKTLLTQDNPEALFDTETTSLTQHTQLSATFQDLHHTTTPIKLQTRNWEEGVFNAILIRLSPKLSTTQGVNQLNQFFKIQHLPLKAVPWSKAIGILGQIALIMKAALYLFVGFIFFVAVMIMTNTLSLAALERITEIGMMRAIGARRGLIVLMFILETGMLSLTFGSLGLLSGWITVLAIHTQRLTTHNEMLQILYGGDVFSPILGASDILQCILLLSIVTVLAVIYPLTIANKITPLDAISTE